MVLTSKRPILISVMQFEDALKRGERTVWEVIDIARQVGADGVELRRETWPGLDRERAAVARYMADAKLLVTYATHTTLFDRSAQGQQQLCQDIETAATLGAELVRFFPGLVPEVDDDPAWMVAKEIVDYAAARGIIIALENYARTPGGTLAEIQNVLTRLESPALCTNLDIGNYPNHGQDVVAAIDSLADKIIASHVKDKTANPADPPTVLGAGILPLPDILQALAQLPQRIYYIFEFRGGDDPVARIEHSLAYLTER